MLVFVFDLIGFFEQMAGSVNSMNVMTDRDGNPTVLGQRYINHN